MSSLGTSPRRLAWRRLRASPMAMAGLVIVLLMVASGMAASWLAPYGYAQDDFRGREGQGPSRTNWLGVDQQGRDLMSRMLYGARVSLQVAVAATCLSVALGVLAGAAAGYFGGWADEAIMRAADTFSAFPGILLAVAIAAAIEERSLMAIFAALGVVGWPGLARIVRGQVLVVREESFVDAARALGAGRLRVLFRHILPNCMAPVIVAGTVLIAGNILGEAGLGFLGIGVQPPHPSWGGMLAEARDGLLIRPWLCIAPGLAISLTVLGFNLLGDGLRDALDPRRRAD